MDMLTPIQPQLSRNFRNQLGRYFLDLSRQPALMELKVMYMLKTSKESKLKIPKKLSNI